jgi:hypothetical protein
MDIHRRAKADVKFGQCAFHDATKIGSPRVGHALEGHRDSRLDLLIGQRHLFQGQRRGRWRRRRTPLVTAAEGVVNTSDDLVDLDVAIVVCISGGTSRERRASEGNVHHCYQFVHGDIPTAIAVADARTQCRCRGDYRCGHGADDDADAERDAAPTDTGSTNCSQKFARHACPLFVANGGTPHPLRYPCAAATCSLGPAYTAGHVLVSMSLQQELAT